MPFLYYEKPKSTVLTLAVALLIARDTIAELLKRECLDLPGCRGVQGETECYLCDMLRMGNQVVRWPRSE